MKTLRYFLKQVRSTDATAFAAEHAGGFLVYNRADGPLTPVDAKAGATLMRPPLNDDHSGPSSLLDMFAVYELSGALLERELTIGCDQTCDVVVNDESASAEHAHLSIRGQDLVVRDAGSTMGTQVGHQTLEGGQEGVVEPGNSFTLGSVELRYLPADRFHLLVTQMTNQGDSSS